MIDNVRPGSSWARAGLEPGDIILRSNYRDYRLKPAPSGPSNPGVFYWKVGRTYPFEIRRKKENRTVYITFDRMPLKNWVILPRLRPVLANLLVALLELALAIIIAFRRPYDPRPGGGPCFSQ